MKKIKKITAAVLLFFMSVFCLVSCFGNVDSEGLVTVVIENRDGSYLVYDVPLEEIENKNEGGAGVLEALSQRKEDPLSLDMGEGIYGKFINSIGTLVPDASKNEYIGIYTSFEKDFDVSEWVKEIKYEGATLKTSGVGISSLSVESGMILLFRVESY